MVFSNYVDGAIYVEWGILFGKVVCKRTAEGDNGEGRLYVMVIGL